MPRHEKTFLSKPMTSLVLYLNFVWNIHWSIGAKPHPKFSKNAEHYHQRLYHQGYPYENVPQGKNEYPTTMVGDLRMSQQPLQPSPYGVNSQRARSMSRERVGGPFIADVQYGKRAPERTGGKKHFPQKIGEMTEIRKENIFMHKETL